jgi:ribA/ribD-fused uncharacterized protein
MQSEKFTFFSKGPFSQWHQGAPFVINGITYNDAETYMMWYKGQLFSGGKLTNEILNASHPSVAKDLGRKVEGFSLPIWKAAARPGVFVGNMAKFTQHKYLLDRLVATEGTTLVEASPEDTIWGIGLAAADPRAQNRDTWLGMNWLGEVLTDVRDTILRAARL